MIDYKISTYDEAVGVVKEVGILPLSPLVPNHPSLERITAKDSWHTGLETDPWNWRTRFAGDGIAAYGKFFRKKSILISREIFPWVQIIAGSQVPIAKRYEKGEISKKAMELYLFIQSHEGIDTRLLRSLSGMKDKENKKPFDQALLDLQGSLDIVISGIKLKTNELGEKNGWSSTSFETADFWMRSAGLEKANLQKEAARKLLFNYISDRCSQEALAFFKKIL